MLNVSATLFASIAVMVLGGFEVLVFILAIPRDYHPVKRSYQALRERIVIVHLQSIGTLFGITTIALGLGILFQLLLLPSWTPIFAVYLLPAPGLLWFAIYVAMDWRSDIVKLMNALDEPGTRIAPPPERL